ncbi:hypothetical protein BKA83DRAFT_4184790 [Pisolithus microcarpus]|nr:hypothetical protein BKA83DRAFT_4184790 [Pisolithus microcarpus]
MAPNHTATLSLPSTRKSDVASPDVVGQHGRGSHQKTRVGLQLQVNTRHLAAHHLKAYPQCSVDIPSSQHAHEHPAHDSHVSPSHVLSGKSLPRMHSSSSSSPQQIKPSVVLGKRKAEVGGDETNLNPEGDNLSVFTNMPPMPSLPGNGADAGSPVAVPIPGFDHKSPMEGQNSDQGTLSLVSPNKSLEPTKSHGAMDTTPIANMIPGKRPKGQELSSPCKGKQTVENHQRSCSTDTTSSNSSTSLEKTQTPSAEGSERSEDEEKQEGSRKLNRFIQQVQEWADMLEDIRAARGGTLAFEIFGDEPTDCPKLLHILQEIDAKKNWITMQEAQSTRLAKNLNLVLKTV